MLISLVNEAVFDLISELIAAKSDSAFDTRFVILLFSVAFSVVIVSVKASSEEKLKPVYAIWSEI